MSFKTSIFISAVFLSFLSHTAFSNTQNNTENQPEILVSVGDLSITDQDLKLTVNSSPYAIQFNTMDQDEQASLRGGLLRRMVAARLLILEAKNQGIDQSEAFLKDIRDFKLSLLYRAYMDEIRKKADVPADLLKEMKQEYKGKPDELAGARAVYRSGQYRRLRMMSLTELRDKYHFRIFEDRIKVGLTPDDTILAQGDGILITYGDLTKNRGDGIDRVDNPDWIDDQLIRTSELLVVARAAQEAGINVDDKVDSYREEHLSAYLVRQKEKEWIPNDAVLLDYYKKHPELGGVLEKRHIGQLVASSYAQANALRHRMLKGESLFRLAGQYSVDPEGLAQNGDMGWVKEGTGAPEIEAVLKDLKDNEISEIAKTSLGYHILTIIDRRPGASRPFHVMKDKVRQHLLTEKLAHFVNGLAEKYKVVWHLIEDKTAAK